MKRLFGSLLLAGLLAGLVLLPDAQACAPVMGKGQQVAIVSESALIVYDAKTKTEHFIRRGNFRTNIAYFGFLVPTPTQPKLGEVGDEVFNQLEDWTKPEVKVEKRIRYEFPFLLAAAMPGSQADSKALPANGVEVFDRQRVGNFDATVLRATDKKSLQDWLAKHGYDARPQVTDWLEHYIRAKWFITAFQMVKPDQKQPGLDTKAVRMSFQTDRPFYPYREPVDQRVGTPHHGNRFLRVFFVGNQRMDGSLGDETPWPGRAAWANPLEADQRAALNQRLSSHVEVPEGAWLTVFDDRSYPRPGTADLFFSPSVDPSAFRRPPIIHYEEEVRLHPAALVILGVVGAGCVLVVAGVPFLIWRFTRRPPTVA